MILLIGIIYIPNVIKVSDVSELSQKESKKDIVNVVPDIVEVISAKELSEAVGFEVADLENLAFEVKESRYVSYWGNLAQISYIGEQQTMIYRKSVDGKDDKGNNGNKNNSDNSDNSGDYNNYQEVVTKAIGDKQVTLKGNDGEYNLAIWANGGFLYSVSFVEGVAVEEVERIVGGLK